MLVIIHGYGKYPERIYDLTQEQIDTLANIEGRYGTLGAAMWEDMETVNSILTEENQVSYVARFAESE